MSNASAMRHQIHAHDRLAMSRSERMQDAVAERQQHEGPRGQSARAIALRDELVLKLRVQAPLESDACCNRASHRLRHLDARLSVVLLSRRLSIGCTWRP